MTKAENQLQQIVLDHTCKTYIVRTYLLNHGQGKKSKNVYCVPLSILIHAKVFFKWFIQQSSSNIVFGLYEQHGN